MEELLRRHETLAEVEAAGIVGGMGGPLVETDLSQPPLPGLRVFPAVLDELAGLPTAVQDTLLQIHLPRLAAAPQEGLALTQLFHGLWVSICTVDTIDYRIIYEIDLQGVVVNVLLIGTWEDMETRLGAS